MSLLIDPRLLSPPGYPGAPLSAAPEFWGRIINWASDVRAKLGPEGRELVCAWYALHGYPDKNLELDVPTLRREYQAALSKILSRAHSATSSVSSRTFVPEYVGSEEECIALQMDVSGAAESISGIATSRDHWGGSDTEEIRVDPPPPASLMLCVEPCMQLPSEVSERIHKFYKEKRIHIVGAREDARIIDSLVDRLGVNRDDISWLPCERARPPRNIEDRWRRLDPDRDITVCITGRVGHATSEKARVAAQRAGVAHLLVELPVGIEDALVRQVDLSDGA